MFPKYRCATARWAVGLTLLLGLSAASQATETGQFTRQVTSQNIINLQADGRDYMLHRSMLTDWNSYTFHVDKGLGQQDFFYIYPNANEWDDQSSPSSNMLRFAQGDFVVMYPGRFEQEVTIDQDGVYTFRNNDTANADGHFGYWNTPDNFSSFVYSWIFPRHFEVLDYQSNQPGEWVRRNNAIAYYGNQVNNLVFTIRYREKDSDGDGVGDRGDLCPGTPPATSVAANGCEIDSDADGVVDRMDACPDTRVRLPIDAHGCIVDGDKDGVMDLIDQCPETPAGAKVDGLGCALDSDADGVANYKDQCPDTPKGASVDANGCELDSDGDGVVDSRDQCPETPAGASVDANGCELDTDADGVVDSKDQCPETPAGASVDVRGCELDSDGDGVADSRDRCPDTPAGASVDANGCELDSDADGVVDSMDQCPETPAGASVDVRGCELDSDGDGVADSRDQCPETPAGIAVDAKGCALDTDADGVLNAHDLCPNTQPGTRVDATGCDVAAAIELEGVNFHTGSAELTDASLAILDRVANSLQQVPEIRLEVAGHTDDQGESAFNRDLSQRRAESVRDYLVGRGIPAEHLSAMGYGEDRPVADNATREGRAQNRRVELQRTGE